MITVSTLLWRANRFSRDFSSMYDERWVERLYRGFARNLTQPFRFTCYVDRAYNLSEGIIQLQIRSPAPSYGDCIQPLEQDEPMILCGLDTVVTGNIDHLADYCLNADIIALPRDPYAKHQACNGVCLVPAGNRRLWTDWRGENDMEWMRQHLHVFIDDLFPGQVQSWKGAVRDRGLGDTRIVYFHGEEKPHQLAVTGNRTILDHWR